jgi:hypothetical protein
MDYHLCGNDKLIFVNRQGDIVLRVTQIDVFCAAQ